MFRRLVQKLRHKPKSYRDNVAVGIASTVTVAVFAVWAINTPSQLSKLTEDTPDQPGAFSTLFSQIKQQTAAIGESVESIRAAVEESEETNASSTANIGLQEVVNTELRASSSATTTAEASLSEQPAPRRVKISTTTSPGE